MALALTAQAAELKVGYVQVDKILQEAPQTAESGKKLGLMGALTLYLDFVNLFLFLLRLFGGRKN